jgi:hypothetical protein
LGATLLASFGVSATVEPVCLISSATSPYKTIASAIESASSGLVVSCNFNASYNITASQKSQSDSLASAAPAEIAPLVQQHAIVQAPLSHIPMKSTATAVEYKLPSAQHEEVSDLVLLEVTY